MRLENMVKMFRKDLAAADHWNAACRERRVWMMTSNRPIEDWGKLIGDVPSAGAILDRFLHHAIVLPINGKSSRLKEAAGTEAAAEKPAGKES